MDWMLLGGVFVLGFAAGLWSAGVIDQFHGGLDAQHTVAEDDGQ